MDDREKIFPGGEAPPPPPASVAMSEEQFARLLSAVAAGGDHDDGRHPRRGFGRHLTDEQLAAVRVFDGLAEAMGLGPTLSITTTLTVHKASRDGRTLLFESIPALAKRVRVFGPSGVSEIALNGLQAGLKTTAGTDGGIGRIEFIDDRGAVVGTAAIPDGLRPVKKAQGN